MPYIKVFIHYVWTTKGRQPFLRTKDIREAVWMHIKENAKHKGIYIDTIGGYSEHCHCLISLGTGQTIEKIAQLIKGESSFWINKQSFIKSKFAWQDEYFAVSVSEKGVDNVRKYILGQEEHHKLVSFADEYNDFIEKYGFKDFKD
jgi:REP element-mobilizing transposase RayT